MLSWLFALSADYHVITVHCFVDGIKNDAQKRPNSLSSVEEMQGTLNYFSKSLLDPQSLSKVSERLDPSSQPRMSAAPKNLLATSGMVVPLLSNAERKSVSPSINEGLIREGEAVISDGIEVLFTLKFIILYDVI